MQEIKEVVYDLLGVDGGDTWRGGWGTWVVGGSVRTPPTRNFAAMFTSINHRLSTHLPG
jgi:hypothetical protein